MAKVTVILGDESKTLEVTSGELIWDELDRLGTKLPFGCLAGSCGSCRINVQFGENNLSPKGAVETDTVAHISNSYRLKLGENFLKEKNIRLACRARVQGDITISPIKEKF